MNKKSAMHIAVLFAFTYMVSYMTRINFGAVISEIASDTGYARAALATAVTASSVTYGLGQLISGVCADKFKPKMLCFTGLIVTAIVNLLFPFSKSTYTMAALWGINGLAQAFMWPPMVKLMSELMTEDEYKHSTVIVSWGSSAGTILMYLLSPVAIAFLGWRSVFIICGAAALIMSGIWQRLCVDVSASETASSKVKDGGKIFTPMFIMIMLAIVLQGMLRDGITTWMPSLISDTYHLSNVVSIFTGVALPIFSVICFHLAERLYRAIPNNPVKCAGIVFFLGTVSAFVLYVLSGKNAALSVFFSALLTGCMHGVNLLLICMVPPFYKKSGGVATVSGILNSCTYIGSSMSTYGIAVISDKLGWSATILTWIIIAFLGCAVCFACTKLWNKFVFENK